MPTDWHSQAWGALLALRPADAPEMTEAEELALWRILLALEDQARAGKWKGLTEAAAALFDVASDTARRLEIIVLVHVALDMRDRDGAEYLFTEADKSGALERSPETEAEWQEVVEWFNAPKAGRGALGVCGIAARLTKRYAPRWVGARDVAGETAAFKKAYKPHRAEVETLNIKG